MHAKFKADKPDKMNYNLVLSGTVEEFRHCARQLDAGNSFCQALSRVLIDLVSQAEKTLWYEVKP